MKGEPSGSVSSVSKGLKDACKHLDGMEMDSKTLFIGRARKKAEEQAELEIIKMELITQQQVQQLSLLYSSKT